MEKKQLIMEKALELFKDIEKNGGLITQLIEGTIERKISESAEKEQNLFDEGKEVLLGTNKYPNKEDRMKNDLELFPFVKQNPRKTLITPIIEKRLAEKMDCWLGPCGSGGARAAMRARYSGVCSRANGTPVIW